MQEGYNVCNLDLHNDIGAYAAKSPTKAAGPRDFCGAGGASLVLLPPKQPS